MTRPTPAADPAGRLIKLARQALPPPGLSIRAAARQAGVSETHWRHAEAGYERKGGQKLPVRVSDLNLARMAYVVRVGPGRLEAETGRTEAAAILREMQRQPSAPAEPRFADPRLQYVMDTPGLDLETRLVLVDLTRAMIARREAENRPA